MCLFADSGEDFNATDSLEVVFMANMVSSGNTSCTSISIVDDSTLEGPHSFRINIVGSNPLLMTDGSLYSNTEGTASCCIALFPVSTSFLTAQAPYFIHTCIPYV